MAIKQGGGFVVLQRRSSAKPGDVNLQATRLVIAAVDWSRWGTADRKLLNALTGAGKARGFLRGCLILNTHLLKFSCSA
jgi:hypothetical protein